MVLLKLLVVITTTNHPEILDHALIRPGRMDKRLNLRYIIVPDMIEMLEHYFKTTLDPEEEKRIRKLIDHGLEKTAAQLEQLAIEMRQPIVSSPPWKGANTTDPNALPSRIVPPALLIRARISKLWRKVHEMRIPH